ncbi:LytR/AlgR family response regulator transcription factor [Marinoscillum furvescens]|uniref:LytTR family two component transcriptional regulator n=1 Tax=Marinoscillum furvescens DSM 4134 TaxID=1122208 RepID=A0A3D9L779_MARFU|nr:LytTR family DNA-binding domain-containing protein [Marinoscillum furvescens]REE01519.1 LytTR family two component transcriptional regulator [Marinoscillum furvescens DSM 4134]
MRIAIIDDEPDLRATTKALLELYCPETILVGEADGVKSGIVLLQETKPDLVFLDVEINEGTGFDIVKAFPQRNFSVIFVTGHNEYAVRAFKFSAVDYLLKPIDPDELVQAVAKAKSTYEQGISGLPLQALETNLNPKADLKHVILKDAEKVYLVKLEEIIRCESSDNYTRFHLTENRSILVSTTLKEYETLFNGHHFLRCHQSHLINLQHFDFFDKREGGSVRMKDQSVLPVSTRKKDTLLKALEQL